MEGARLGHQPVVWTPSLALTVLPSSLFAW